MSNGLFGMRARLIIIIALFCPLFAVFGGAGWMLWYPWRNRGVVDIVDLMLCYLTATNCMNTSGYGSTGLSLGELLARNAIVFGVWVTYLAAAYTNLFESIARLQWPSAPLWQGARSDV
ncbi:hypothetical protein [Arhodomonas sp. AD133]|uniref:hypothetical protein n=1 Tax=Arhodomonas sp. AD133 TaxID=3415009 RepID=UPI003EC06A32